MSVPMLGEFITRELPDNTCIPRADILAALTTAGLPTHYAGELSMSAAFARAVKQLAADAMIHDVREDTDHKRFQLDRRAFDTATDRVRMDYQATVQMDRITGHITSDDPTVESLAKSLIAGALENRKTSDLGRLFREIAVGEAKAFAKKCSTVSFFVADQYRQVVDKLATFVSLIGGSLERLPIVDILATERIIAAASVPVAPQTMPAIASTPVVTQTVPGCGIPAVVETVEESLRNRILDIQSVVNVLHAKSRESTVLRACSLLLELEEECRGENVRALIGGLAEIVIDHAALARKTIRDRFTLVKSGAPVLPVSTEPQEEEPTLFTEAPRPSMPTTAPTAPASYTLSGVSYAPPASFPIP